MFHGFTVALLYPCAAGVQLQFVGIMADTISFMIIMKCLYGNSISILKGFQKPQCFFGIFVNQSLKWRQNAVFFALFQADDDFHDLDSEGFTENVYLYMGFCYLSHLANGQPLNSWGLLIFSRKIYKFELLFHGPKWLSELLSSLKIEEMITQMLHETGICTYISPWSCGHFSHNVGK